MESIGKENQSRMSNRVQPEEESKVMNTSSKKRTLQQFEDQHAELKKLEIDTKIRILK